jgi:hypothetical protein
MADEPDLLRDVVPPYRPVSRLRRALVVAPLGVGTALGIAWLMLERVGAPPLPPPAADSAADPAANPAVVPAAAPAAVSAPAAGACPPGQTQGCVGGRTQVLVVPSTAPQAAPR